MGTGDYICVTLRGGAPWGFTLREGEGDTYIPFLVAQVEEDGRAFLAGVRDGDEVVSINGEPCADLSLLRAFALIDTSIDCLQLLVKRFLSSPAEDSESEGERASSGEPGESTTLHILSSKHSSHFSSELHISETQDELSQGESDRDAEFHEGPQLLWTELHAPPFDNQRGQEADFENNNEEGRRCFSPGDMVELQVSLDDVGCTSLGCARGIEGELLIKEYVESHHTTTSSHVPIPAREPLGQRGVVVSSPSMLGQVEVTLQHPEATGSGRGIVSVGGPRVSESVGSQSEGEEGGGHCEGVPGSFTVSFEIPPQEGAPAEEQDSDSEGDQDKPNKHRARHARLRRSESQSEKQVKEAKSKCKRIALLLTAAPSNPNNKGVLMFKKHRQRAKKYTLVSYGTGDDEPEYSEDEDEESGDDKQEIPTVEFTLVAHDGSEIDKHFLTNAKSSKGVLTLNWDKGLLEIERNLNDQAKMECLPETKGKGAAMFAQRRLRMDEISAEHEELRRHGIPVEGVPEPEKKTAELSCMQATTEAHAYMDVNMHQQSQQQHQQYQEQQYYQQQQNYQQQQQYQQYQQQQYEQSQYQQQQQQQQYEQSQYQQQQMYQQQQEYHQEQQVQQYSTNINGTVQHQMNELSFSNRTAKPFSAENMVATPYAHAMSGTNEDSAGQGEQIASRDERISTPASKTGFLMDARKRSTGKPMFTFKDAPKVSPNPELLNLLNRGDKKGFESGPEEDYLSLGAEACNFLQSQRLKNKAPPPVAPKPMINANCPPWSSQIEEANPDVSQCAENSLSTPAAAPTAEVVAAPEPEPTPAPASEPSPPPAPQEAQVSTSTAEQHAWTPSEPEPQGQPMQVIAQEANGPITSTLQPESTPVTSWSATQAQVQQPSLSSSWQQPQAQPQEPPPSQSPPQPPWVTRHSSQNQAQLQQPPNTWNPQIQPSWAQPPEQPQSQAQVQPSWTQPNEQQHPQQMQPTWGQPQEPMQPQPQNPWIQQSQTDSQPQPPWVQQAQKTSQPQPPWVKQVQPEPQPQQPWLQQPQQQALSQAWPQTQAPSQPPWMSAQPQSQQQPSTNAWPPAQPQAQAQPPWIQGPQAPPQAQPQAQPQASLNPWAPVPAQEQTQPPWVRPPQEGQQSWGHEQNQAQSQPPWAQPVPPQPAQQPSWQQPSSNTPPQPPMNTWPPPQAQPQQPSVNPWTPQPQQKPIVLSTPNTQPSPKPWLAPQNAPQNKIPPPPPQRMHSFTVTQRSSSPINPMATLLNPSSAGSAVEMPVVRGKGADMFAKRQSRMEKFVVDSETVEANKASRPTSPAASLPNEWKYTPNVRAPPPRAYNPILSPSYPPAATKQLPSSISSAKSKKKEKPKPAPKPLNVIDVMKHQPYQLSSSLFIFGPEPPKPPTPKPSPPPNPPCENQPIQYEQMAPVQPAGQFGGPYPQQGYGMPMQPMMHGGHYQQPQTNVYPPPNPYQQPPVGPYQQQYNQQYQQPPPPAYHPQAPQSANSPYQHPQALQAAYQPAQSPPYLATPSAPYQQQQQAPQQLSSSYVAPNFPVAARPEPASGGNTVAAAPKPKFTAKKSSAQAFGWSYSLSPPARVPFAGQKSASASSSPRPPAQASTTPRARQTSWLEAGHKPLTPWEAASRHPLGLVDEAFSFQNLQQTLASNVRLAAQRKMLPKPPIEWCSRVSYQAPQKTGSQTWSPSPSRSQSRAPIPSFVSSARGPVSSNAGYNSLPRQWQPQRSNLGSSGSPSECKRPLGTQTYKSSYTSNTWSWRR